MTRYNSIVQSNGVPHIGGPLPKKNLRAAARKEME